MSEEDKKAIEYLEDSLKNTVTHKEKFNIIKNLIKSQQEELEKKDKIIDLMLDMLVRVHSENKQIELIANANIEEKKKQAKEYLKKKVEESNAK